MLQICVFMLMGLSINVAAQSSLYEQIGTDDLWPVVRDALESQETDNTGFLGGYSGSNIDVYNHMFRRGPNANNPAFNTFGNGIRIHTVGNSTITQNNFQNWDRWYQEDENTQIFRLFKDEENVRNDRPLAARTEAFDRREGFAFGDGWHEFSARYTIMSNEGGMIFQAKNPRFNWSVSIIYSNGNVTLNHRRHQDDRIIAINAKGRSFDMRILEDGHNYLVFINDELVGAGLFDRPTLKTDFRWGIYKGENTVNENILMFVTGVSVGDFTPSDPVDVDLIAAIEDAGDALIALDTGLIVIDEDQVLDLADYIFTHGFE